MGLRAFHILLHESVNEMVNVLLMSLSVFKCFRIQKDRVSERDKDLEVLQEKLAEKVSEVNRNVICAAQLLKKHCKYILIFGNPMINYQFFNFYHYHVYKYNDCEINLFLIFHLCRILH